MHEIAVMQYVNVWSLITNTIKTNITDWCKGDNCRCARFTRCQCQCAAAAGVNHFNVAAWGWNRYKKKRNPDREVEKKKQLDSWFASQLQKAELHCCRFTCSSKVKSLLKITQRFLLADFALECTQLLRWFKIQNLPWQCYLSPVPSYLARKLH